MVLAGIVLIVGLLCVVAACNRALSRPRHRYVGEQLTPSTEPDFGARLIGVSGLVLCVAAAALGVIDIIL